MEAALLKMPFQHFAAGLLQQQVVGIVAVQHIEQEPGIGLDVPGALLGTGNGLLG